MTTWQECKTLLEVLEPLMILAIERGEHESARKVLADLRTLNEGLVTYEQCARVLAGSIAVLQVNEVRQ